jgi:hypothetical protein
MRPGISRQEIKSAADGVQQQHEARSITDRRTDAATSISAFPSTSTLCYHLWPSSVSETADVWTQHQWNRAVSPSTRHQSIFLWYLLQELTLIPLLSSMLSSNRGLASRILVVDCEARPLKQQTLESLGGICTVSLDGLGSHRHITISHPSTACH